MGNLWLDLRYGLRTLWKSPGFTAVALVTLALGIGANTAVFSLINGVLLRPLPFAAPERLVLLTQKTPQISQRGFSAADLFDFKEQSRSFESFAGFSDAAINVGGAEGAERLPASYVTSDYFHTLGVPLALGRAFQPADDQPGASQSVIISHRLWQQRFGGDPHVLDQSVTLDGKPFNVVGVAPAGFRLYSARDLWLPFGFFPSSRERTSHYAMFVVARLKEGVTMQAAQAEMDAIASRLSQQYPESNADAGAQLYSLHQDIVGDIRSPLLLLSAAVGFVLLIACANIANLLLARGAARQKEIVIRAALGASRARIVRQLLTESLLMSLVGGAAGLLVAFWAADLVQLIGAADIPRIQEVFIDRRVLLFSLAVSLLAGFVFGIVPALQTTKTDLVVALKDAGKGTGGFIRQRMRGFLVVSEIALALVLLVGAGLMIKSLAVLRGVNPGYNPEGVLTVEVSLPRAKYKDESDKARFAGRVLERVSALPGVERAAASYPMPIYGRAWGMFYQAEGQPEAAPGKYPLAQVASVSPDFFRALEVPLLQGRAFAESDTQNAPGVAVVDETLARLNWGGENPIGKHVTIRTGEPARTVVGLVGSVKNAGLGAQPLPQIYIPYQQKIEEGHLVPFVYLELRTKAEPLSLARAAREAVRDVDGDAAVSEVKPMAALLDESVGERRFSAVLLGLFSALALVLASVGIYGVMAYTVAQRTHEIGIRMALGAQASDILALVVKQSMRLVAFGVAVGLAASFAAARLIRDMLFQVSANDPATFAGVALLLSAVALAACYVPARRATRVDPLVALRDE